MRESVKNYLALASGLTELTLERAVSAAEALVAQGEAAREQVTALAEELLVSSKSNREAVAALVRVEIDRAMTRLGATNSDDVSALFRNMESALRDTAAKAADAVHELAVGMGLSQQSAAPRPVVKQTRPADEVARPAARKTAAKKPAARKVAAKKPAARTTAAKKPTARKTAATKAVKATKVVKAVRAKPAKPSARTQ